MNTKDLIKTKLDIRVVPFSIGEALQHYTNKEDFRGTIMHGCNCKKTMGAGVAKWVRETFPAAYDIDCIWGVPASKRFGDFTNALGTFENATESNILVYNLYTQYNIREFNTRTSEFTKPFLLAAFEAAFAAALKDLYVTKIHVRSLRAWDYPIFLPCIGAGLGGGDWLEIQTAILSVAIAVGNELCATLPTIYVCIPLKTK